MMKICTTKEDTLPAHLTYNILVKKKDELKIQLKKTIQNLS